VNTPNDGWHADPRRTAALVGVLALLATFSTGAQDGCSRLKDNWYPSVEVGPSQTITWPTCSVYLDANVSDDGRPDPPAQVTFAWSVASGAPGTVVFDDANSTHTRATFSNPGTYTIIASANDSDLSDEETLQVIVLPPPVVGPDANAVLPPYPPLTLTNPAWERFINPTSGTDTESNGASPGNGAWKTLAYALQRVYAAGLAGPSGGPGIIHLAAGSYPEPRTVTLQSETGFFLFKWQFDHEVVVQGEGDTPEDVTLTCSEVSPTLTWGQNFLFGGMGHSCRNITLRHLKMAAHPGTKSAISFFDSICSVTGQPAGAEAILFDNVVIEGGDDVEGYALINCAGGSSDTLLGVVSDIRFRGVQFRSRCTVTQASPILYFRFLDPNYTCRNVTFEGCEIDANGTRGGATLMGIRNLTMNDVYVHNTASIAGIIPMEIGTQETDGATGYHISGQVSHLTSYTGAGHGILFGRGTADSAIVATNLYSETAGYALLFRGGRNVQVSNSTLISTDLEGVVFKNCENCALLNSVVTARGAYAIDNMNTGPGATWVNAGTQVIGGNLIQCGPKTRVFRWGWVKESGSTICDDNTYDISAPTTAGLSYPFGFMGDATTDPAVPNLADLAAVQAAWDARYGDSTNDHNSQVITTPSSR